MKELNRRKFLKWMGLGAATVTTGAFLCSDCAMADNSNVVSGRTSNTRCPHRFCKRYRPPEGETDALTYNLYTDKEGYCLSKAFKGMPRI